MIERPKSLIAGPERYVTSSVISCHAWRRSSASAAAHVVNHAVSSVAWRWSPASDTVPRLVSASPIAASSSGERSCASSMTM
jgi:hypothetical protein